MNHASYQPIIFDSLYHNDVMIYIEILYLKSVSFTYKVLHWNLKYCISHKDEKIVNNN